MSQRIIINADDYGYTAGVSDGILLAAAYGTVPSTTVMANIPEAGAAVVHAQQHVPALAFGVHLVLTFGAPLTAADKVPTLVSPTGRFFSLAEIESNPTRVDPDELLREWCAQVERLLALGVEVDHLDSHHHSSYLHPHLAEVMLRVATMYGVVVRRPPRSAHQGVLELFKTTQPTIRMPDLLVEDLFEGSSFEKLKAIVRALPAETLCEIMVHPGVVDAELMAGSSYATPRAAELETLLHPDLPAFLESSGVVLTTFGRALGSA
jgi:predicted glycoside hydrolase/deacetylase ChbG (UPF0249 family)